MIAHSLLLALVPSLPASPWLPTVGTLVVALAIVLLLAGVVGSLVPGLPGPLLTLAGLGTYWAGTGFTDPGLLALVVLAAVALAALVVDWSGGIVAAKTGGASTKTSFFAGLVGFCLAFLTGPVGVVVGVAGTVFAVEYYHTNSVDESFRTASLTTLSLLGTGIVQALLTGTVLLGVLAVHVL